MLDEGKSIVKQMVGLLTRDGFEDPGLGYAGRLVRSGEKLKGDSDVVGGQDGDG